MSLGSTSLSGIWTRLGNSPLPKRRVPGPALERVRISVAVWPQPTVKSNCFGFQLADAASATVTFTVAVASYPSLSTAVNVAVYTPAAV